MRTIRTAPAAALVIAACAAPSPDSPTTVEPGSDSSSVAASPAAAPTAASPQPSSATPSPSPIPETHEFEVTAHEDLDSPWALAFIPGTDQLLITQRGGSLLLRDADGLHEISGVPKVHVADQGGLGDIAVADTFPQDQRVYLSWSRADDSGRRGAVVAQAKLDLAGRRLTDLEVLWRQRPTVDSDAHLSHRIALQGEYLFISSGERRLMEPAQDLSNNLGSIVHLNLDGSPAAGNPWAGQGNDVTDQLYSIGHRNPLGLAFDADGRLWASEMGPMGGDELNLIEAGGNYGWPEASNGSHYDGTDIPDHSRGDGFVAPKAWWDPSISPGSLMIYAGDMFPAWRGDAFLGALSGEALVRVDLEGEKATKAEEWPLDERIRAVAEAPDGAIWLLTDGDDGRLLELRVA